MNLKICVYDAQISCQFTTNIAWYLFYSGATSLTINKTKSYFPLPDNFVSYIPLLQSFCNTILQSRNIATVNPCNWAV